MANKIIQKIVDKYQYEKESYRMSQEELKRVMREHPEAFEAKGRKR